MLILLSLSFVSYLLSFIPAFCDIYTEQVYSRVSDALARVTDLVDIAVIEVLIVLALMALLGFLALVTIKCFLVVEFGGHSIEIYLKSLIVAVLLVVFLFTQNMLIPYRGTFLGGVYTGDYAYTTEELIAFREDICARLLKTADEVSRHEGLMVWYDEATVENRVSKAMEKQSGTYRLLKGRNPALKHISLYPFIENINLGGIVSPLTGEVLRGTQMIKSVSYPTLIAHEMCHHKGYYREDEAEFLSYKICSESDDPFLRYSGLYMALYLADDVIIKEGGEEAYRRLTPVPDEVIFDTDFVTEKDYIESHFKEDSVERWGFVWEIQSYIIDGNDYKDAIKIMLEDHYKGR